MRLNNSHQLAGKPPPRSERRSRPTQLRDRRRVFLEKKPCWRQRAGCCVTPRFQGQHPAGRGIGRTRRQQRLKNRCSSSLRPWRLWMVVTRPSRTLDGAAEGPDFQKVLPSRSPSFKRLSSSTSALFLPSVHRVLRDQKYLSFKQRHQTAAGIAIADADHAAAGDREEDRWSRTKKGRHSWLQPRLRRPSTLWKEQKPANGSQRRRKRNLLLPACLLDFTISVQLLFYLHRYCSLICTIFILILVPSGQTKHFSCCFSMKYSFKCTKY